MGIGRYVGTCGEYMKYALFIINVFLFLAGVAIMSVAIWMIVYQENASDIVGNKLYKGITYVLCGAGAFVAIVSFLGCTGSIKEVKCLLGLYSLIVFIIFVLMLVGGILGFVYKEKLNDKISENMYTSLKVYDAKPAWDWLQSNFQCCGVAGSENWPGNTKPKSCCSGDFACTSDNESHLYKYGCLEKMQEFLEKNANIIAGCGIGLACLTLMCLIFSCCLSVMIDYE